jgi:hypothetical protein
VDPFVADFRIGRNLLIECNGIQHYVQGDLKFNEKRRIQYFQHRGYKVVSIGVEEWNKLDCDEKMKFIKKLK